ncbi:MAG: hypothetical protein IT379_43030, partial [Deltaproteobacteria bacterium]|nr:hypothetical protein [Deltaproteobacteria bacterium]
LGFDSRFGTRVQPEVRWSSTAAGLAAAPWTAIDPSTLSIPGGPYAAFVQIRLVLTGDGTETPRVRSVALDGSRCMP